MINRILTRLFFGRPAKGEPVLLHRPKRYTIMPTSEMTLLKWQRGGWSDYINKPNSRNA